MDNLIHNQFPTSRPNMKPKLIIFDFSGTLAYFKKSDQKNFFSGLADFGIAIKAEEAKSFNRLFWKMMSEARNLEDFSKKLLSYFSVKNDREVVEKATIFFNEFVSFELFDDVREIINLPVNKVILSSAADFLIERDELKDFIVFGSQKSQFQKPDPRAFLAVLNKLGIDPELAVMVGDEAERDLVPAQKLGIETVLIDRKNEEKNYSGKKISSLKEIKKLFDF